MSGGRLKPRPTSIGRLTRLRERLVPWAFRPAYGADNGASVTLVPPKPNEFDSAWRSGIDVGSSTGG